MLSALLPAPAESKHTQSGGLSRGIYFERLFFTPVPPQLSPQLRSPSLSDIREGWKTRTLRCASAGLLPHPALVITDGQAKKKERKKKTRKPSLPSPRTHKCRQLAMKRKTNGKQLSSVIFLLCLVIALAARSCLLLGAPMPSLARALGGAGRRRRNLAGCPLRGPLGTARTSRLPPLTGQRPAESGAARGRGIPAASERKACGRRGWSRSSCPAARRATGSGAAAGRSRRPTGASGDE